MGREGGCGTIHLLGHPIMNSWYWNLVRTENRGKKWKNSLRTLGAVCCQAFNIRDIYLPATQLCLLSQLPVQPHQCQCDHRVCRKWFHLRPPAGRDSSGHGWSSDSASPPGLSPGGRSSWSWTRWRGQAGRSWARPQSRRANPRSSPTHPPAWGREVISVTWESRRDPTKGILCLSPACQIISECSFRLGAACGRRDILGSLQVTWFLSRLWKLKLQILKAIAFWFVLVNWTLLSCI